jgi:hypothetical protein
MFIKKGLHMPRRSSLDGMSVEEIARYLKARRKETRILLRERRALAKQIAKIDRRLGAADSAPRGGRGRGRRRNEQPLADVVVRVLAHGKPMKVTDIAAAVRSAGYHSDSPNFRSMVNQALIKHRDRFKQAKRSYYQLIK